jgi:hypothetical protein
VDDVDNPWISSISTRIYPPSMDIYLDVSMVVPRLMSEAHLKNLSLFEIYEKH